MQMYLHLVLIIRSLLHNPFFYSSFFHQLQPIRSPLQRNIHLIALLKRLRKPLKMYSFQSLKFSFIIVILASISLLVATQEDLQEGEIHIGSYGYICTSECRKRGYSYNWCEARHPTSDLPGITYWDYCSKKQDHDYRGRRCWHEHACGNHGYKYKWCYTGEEGKSWGHCGLNVIENP